MTGWKKFAERWLGSGRPSEPGHIRAPEVPNGCRVYAVGDIHGRIDLLHELHRKISADSADFSGRKTLVYLGDYVDRGMQSREVIETLSQSPMEGFESVSLLGNHEQTMLDFLNHPVQIAGWLTWGGRETLSSYGIRIPHKIDNAALALLSEELRSNLPREHLQFLNSLELLHEEGDYLFVHAGVRPGVPISGQSRDDLLWIREDFLESQEPHERVVVHGHSISETIEEFDNRIGIDTGAYYSGVLSCLVLESDSRRFLQTG